MIPIVLIFPGLGDVMYDYINRQDGNITFLEMLSDKITRELTIRPRIFCCYPNFYNVRYYDHEIPDAVPPKDGIHIYKNEIYTQDVNFTLKNMNIQEQCKIYKREIKNFVNSLGVIMRDVRFIVVSHSIGAFYASHFCNENKNCIYHIQIDPSISAREGQLWFTKYTPSRRVDSKRRKELLGYFDDNYIKKILRKLKNKKLTHNEIEKFFWECHEVILMNYNFPSLKFSTKTIIFRDFVRNPESEIHKTRNLLKEKNNQRLLKNNKKTLTIVNVYDKTHYIHNVDPKIIINHISI